MTENKIRRLFTFIYEEMEDMDAVKPEKKEEFSIGRINVTEEVIVGNDR